jgi:hypothetical protein
MSMTACMVPLLCVAGYERESRAVAMGQTSVRNVLQAWGVQLMYECDRTPMMTHHSGMRTPRNEVIE